MAASSDQNPTGSTAELMRQLSEQTTRLVRDEVALAKAELSEKGKRAGIGAGMFGAAAVLALFGLGALVATAISALALGLSTWLAALIVAVVLFGVAGALALVGKGQVQRAVPPAPEEAMNSVKTDIDVVKERAQSGRSSA
jgi:uncharacterized membrane protein YqjE